MIDLKDNNHMSNKNKNRRLIKVKEDNPRFQNRLQSDDRNIKEDCN